MRSEQKRSPFQHPLLTWSGAVLAGLLLVAVAYMAVQLVLGRAPNAAEECRRRYASAGSREAIAEVDRSTPPQRMDYKRGAAAQPITCGEMLRLGLLNGSNRR